MLRDECTIEPTNEMWKEADDVATEILQLITDRGLAFGTVASALNKVKERLMETKITGFGRRSEI